MESIINIIDFIANVFTILISGIGLYVAIFKQEAVKSFFRLILNYVGQLSISELKSKLDQINNLSVNNSSQRDEIVNIFSDIIGQIKGNHFLKEKFKDTINTLESIVSGRKQLNEPLKRSVVSEIREKLRFIDIYNFNEITGDPR